MYNLKIMKTELTFGENTYKFTKAYLSLIKRIYGYLHIIENFKSIRNDTLNRLYDLLKFYNSYSIELLIDRKAV